MKDFSKMLTMVKLLVLALSIALSQARPQEDVEAVTSLEALLEDTSLEAGDLQLDYEDQGILPTTNVNSKCQVSQCV